MSASESRSAVVLELAEEFLERYRQGERPSLKEYIDRHPELAAEIKEVFPAMAMMENVALADESLAGADTPGGEPAPPESLQHLGDYHILREVGRGGMGIVYEAEQVSLGRHVALKVLPRKTLLDATQKRRFEREAKAAARLHHTNIVPVFGVGEHDGLPYYVMQFIQGLGLDEVLDELKRLQGGGTSLPPTLSPQGGRGLGEGGGGLRVSRKDVPAVDVARSLLTGEFQRTNDLVESPEPEASAPRAPTPETDAPDSPDSSAGRLSDSSAVSSSSVTLPASRVKGKKTTYWQSVAQIGVQVADALEYAHKQGILHRDIKPSNLLLDTRGTVWVTDFGLARAETEEHLTHTGDIVGTLRYMPPEAFEGWTDKRSDLYSLGLTLYELLALRPAFEEKDRRQLIKRVTTEEPTRLDKLNRTIPRDLVTIVHKAIDRDRVRRYATAAEFAADLQRFLDDEPIRARRVSAVERGWRWCRHHPGVAGLTAALTLLLVGATAASLLAAAHFVQLADKERVARQEADQAKEHESALRKQAEEAQQQEKTAKRQAEANFAKARKAVDDSFTTVSENQLLKVPGMQPLRRDLLQSALAFYQDFLKEHGDDPAVRGELAAAYLRLGKIRTELEEGTEARKPFEQARQLYDALRKTAPESVEWRHGLAECYYRLDRNEDAIALWEQLVQPGQPRFQKELAMAYNYRGNAHQSAGRSAEALQAHQQALTIREMLVRLNPEEVDAQRDLGITLNNIGILLAKKERLGDALVMYRRAVEHVEAAFARAPQAITNGQLVVIGQGNIASIERELGHPNEALAAYRRIVEVRRKLARDNPAVPSLHSGLFHAYRELAQYQRELKQTGPYERTLRLAREALDRMPSDGAEALYNLACIRAECATLLGQGKEKPTAEEQAEQKQEADLAVEALRKAVAAGFRDAARLRTAAALNPLRRREDFQAVEADLAARLATAPQDKLKKTQQALDQREKLAQADPNNKRLQADLAASQYAMALIQFDLGKHDEARKHLEQAVALREALVKDEPNNAQYQTDLALSRFALGDFSWQAGRLAEAAKLWRSELGKLEAAERAGDNRLSASGQLLTLRRTIAQHYARAGLWTEAAFHFDQLLPFKGASAQDHYNAACLALRAGDGAAYRRCCEAMVKRFGETQEFYPLGFLAWACVLADGAGNDPARAIERARKMSLEGAPVWQCHILGLAHYRAGLYSEALVQAGKSNTLNPAWLGRILNGPVLAMAHHRLGHAAEARQWLDKSTQEWRRLSPLLRTPGGLLVFPSNSPHWRGSLTWHDWPTFEILLREAAVLIAGAPPVEDAFDHAHRSLLYSRLGDSAKTESEWQTAVKIAPREPMIYLVRARQLVEAKRRKEAETALAKIEEFTSDKPDVWKERGRLYFELGQTVKAAADFRKALDLLGDRELSDEPLVSEADKLFNRLELTAYIERKPQDIERRRKRGEWYARHWRWKEAAGDFKTILERRPPADNEGWLHVAPVLAAGDREGYRWQCREMRKRFGNTQDPTTAERIAKSALLLPELTGEMQWACTLADRAVERGQKHSYLSYFRFCKGLADYRRENYRAAIEGIDPLVTVFSNNPSLRALCHLVLAMAYHRQKDAKAAREHLAQGAKLLDQYLPDPARSAAPAPATGYSHDFLIAWLLHREAKELIDGKKVEPKK